MAEIRSLNGYNLKDEIARSQISTLQSSFNSHNHDDSYYKKSEIDATVASLPTIEDLTGGDITVANATEAQHAASSDNATEAAHAVAADSATKATQDANGAVITDTYETKSDASSKLDEAKSYADTQIAALVNSAPETLDTLGELATAFQENEEVVAALNAAITNKADIDHVHSWNDLSNKPFYENKSETVILEDGVRNTEFLGPAEGAKEGYGDGNGNLVSSALVIGDTYVLTFDGVDYVGVAEWVEDTSSEGNNGVQLDFYAEGQSESFAGLSSYSNVMYWAFTEDKNYSSVITFSVKHVESTVKTLDPKYLPDTVADKTYVDEAVANIDIPEQVNADWSVNDPSSPAYIANRTHWIGDSVETFLVEEMTVEIAEANGYAQIPYYEQWVIGETYTVTFNGTRYDCVAYQGDEAVLIGNGEVFGGGSGGNGEPFSCDSYDGETAYVNVAEAGTHTISISHLVNEIHKIDPIFLPEQAQTIGKAGEGLGAEIFNYYGDDGGVSTFALAPDDSPTSNVATGEYSHAEGYLTSATGDYSHTEGGNTKASGFCSHAEGIFTTATEEAAHAEGSNTTAYGQHSHAEGSSTEASGLSSHAEGTMTIAAGESSHAEGYYTEANGDYQHVQGKHNVADGSSVYAHIVGNGANRDEPSNAHTLDWSGNAWYQGDIYIGGTVTTSEDGTVDYSGAHKVALKSDLDAITAITNEEIDAIFASI